jgi:hypothetical protein
MSAAVDSRQQIAEALAALRNMPLRQAATGFLGTLGYASSRTLPTESVEGFCRQFDAAGLLEYPSALKKDWKSIDLLFQLTDEDIAHQDELFDAGKVQTGQLKSYLFFAIELTGDHYARGKLTALARQINRLFPMPVMVLMKHLADKREVLSIAVINRRQNQRDATKDVLGKVTIIRDISLAEPHRGHLDILDSLVVSNLVHPQKKPINDFDSLHEAWEEIFNIELLNKRFYKELSNWYFWALPQVEFPEDLEKDSEKRRATGLIRLLTRLIFCWFLKEKDGLIPEKLFHPTYLAKILKGFDPESETSSTYYLAILQNLFFATLNQRMGKDSKGNPYRAFAADEGFQKNRATHDVNTLYRYENLFAVPHQEAIALFADIPFLNGGLFECLDRADEDTNKKLYLDGFSRNAKKRPHVPDRLFFDSGETADLSEVYGDRKHQAEKVTGLISILSRYKFTIVENTPIDQEIALDPELLGKVFENLLASYNEETKTTARKQTGSFYTPRPIVEYIVDESLKAHLKGRLTERAGMKEEDAKASLDLLFTYTEQEHPFSDEDVATLITAVDELKILDPACGSGAFPMGVLHKLVYILGKLDPDNARWKEAQLSKLDSAPMREALEAAFADNDDDYGRKLSLIENCLYGVDIQPIAIQITKLRFFISLVCDQRTNRNKKDNNGIRPLPNLETKFVAADTLVDLPLSDKDLFLDSLISPIEKEIEAAYHGHFTIQRRDHKLALQKKIKALRLKLADTIAGSLGSLNSKKAKHLAEWDPFDPQSCADFFDPQWMFGRSVKDGFDLVIGNPPYISVEMFARTRQQEIWRNTFKTFAARADIYSFFYERGLSVLRKNGTLGFITSNKFLRVNSGKALRKFLAEHSRVEVIIDFKDAPVFTATTYPLIFIGSNSAGTPREFDYCEWPKTKPIESIAEVLTRSSASVASDQFYTGRLCSSESGIGLLRSDVATKCTTLKDIVGGRIYSGIKTGLNNAFIISESAASAIILEDPSAEPFVKPFLKGKDLNPWRTDPTNRFIIYTPHGVTLPKSSAILRHLRPFKARLEARALDQKWFELQQPQRNFTGVFEGTKIIYPNVSLGGNFSLNTGCYLDMTVFCIDSAELWLLGLLNSDVVRHFLAAVCVQRRGGYLELKTQYMRLLPVPLMTSEEKTGIAGAVANLMAASGQGGHSAPMELLNSMVNDAYGLSLNDVTAVKGALAC